ncbi:GNAT family N-acetyltransferase [Nonomuraea ferruginea]
MFSDKPVLTGERVTLRPVGGRARRRPVRAGLRSRGAAADRLPRRLRAGGVAGAGAPRGLGQADRLDLAIEVGGDYVGEVVLNELGEPNLSCNLRIALIGDRAFGRGYGTEAITLALDHAFRTTPLHRVGLEVFAFNDRARHVYEKLGFVEEGQLRDALRWDGEWYDSLVMSVLRPDWQARSGLL